MAARVVGAFAADFLTFVDFLGAVAVVFAIPLVYHPCYYGDMSKDVPFYPNTDDNLHCQQAAFMSILKYFRPDYETDWAAWDNITGFEKDKATWSLATLLWFHEHGFEVKHIEGFDFEAFAKDGQRYFEEQYAPEVLTYAISIAHTNFAAEQARANTISKLDIAIDRNPTLEDITQALDQGFLVRATVNSRALNNKEGYFGHAVTVIEYDDIGFTLHDPGLPPIPNRKLSFKDFASAWFDKDRNAEMDAIKLP